MLLPKDDMLSGANLWRESEAWRVAAGTAETVWPPPPFTRVSQTAQKPLSHLFKQWVKQDPQISVSAEMKWPSIKGWAQVHSIRALRNDTHKNLVPLDHMTVLQVHGEFSASQKQEETHQWIHQHCYMNSQLCPQVDCDWQEHCLCSRAARWWEMKADSHSHLGCEWWERREGPAGQDDAVDPLVDQLLHAEARGETPVAQSVT